MGSSVKLVTKDELTTGNYFNADNLIGGENTTIVKDGNVYKINVSAGESFKFISESDNGISVGEGATYITVNGYTAREIHIGGGANQNITIGMQDTASNNVITEVWADDFIVHTFGDSSMETGNIKLYGNITDKNNNEIFGLTSDNAGNNITITGSGSTLKINAEATASYPHITDSDKVTISVNGSSNTFAFTADNISSLNTLITNRESYLTENVADGRYAKKTELNYKQDQLTSDNAGDNITITGSGSTLKINATASANLKYYSENETDKSVSIATPSDSTGISLSTDAGTVYFTGPGIWVSSAEYTEISSSKLVQVYSSGKIELRTVSDSASDGIRIEAAGEGSIYIAGPIFHNGCAQNHFINNTYLHSAIYDKNNNEILGLPHIADNINDPVRISAKEISDTFTFTAGNINSLNRIVGKDFIHLTRPNWGTMEDAGVYYVDMISDSGPFNFQTGLSMAAANGKVYTAELHIHYNENIDSPVWPDTWQWVDEDDVTQPTPVPSGSNGKWICYTVRSVNGFTLVHLDHIYGVAS